MNQQQAQAAEKHAKFTSFLQRQLRSRPEPVLSQNVNLNGQTAVVTGSNSGIGFECCSQLLDLGLSRLILAVRNKSKGDDARSRLLAGRKQESVAIEVLLLDMASYDSIRAFVEALKTEQRLDIAILNAGVSNEKLRIVPETGTEEIIQVNYISTVLLTILLLPLLKEKQVAGKPNRLVLVSSDTASWSKAKPTAPILSPFKKPTKFDRSTQYDASKLFGQLFIAELSKRIPSTTTTIVMANPGLCSKTGLSGQRSTAEGFAFYLICSALGHSAAVGAVSLTGAAVQHGQEAHGCYIDNNKISLAAPLVYSEEGQVMAKALWGETMEELSFIDPEQILNGLSS